MTDVEAQSEDHAPDQPHPSTFSPATFALLIVLAIFGAIIGIQLILQLGVTPNTSIIGALVAMILARVPLTLFARYRSVHVQNLAQSNISAATFGAANSVLVPIGIPFLLGRGDLILPMLVGAALAMLLDAYLLYRMLHTKVFPASGTWPTGVAAAEAIKAGDQGGRQGLLLAAGLVIGMAGSWLKIPMSAFGVAFIGNIAALSMFGVGLLIRGYTLPVTGIDITQYYVPHGFMVGAGIVALVQVIMTISQRADADKAAGSRSDEELRGALKIGAIGYVAIAASAAAPLSSSTAAASSFMRRCWHSSSPFRPCGSPIRSISRRDSSHLLTGSMSQQSRLGPRPMSPGSSWRGPYRAPSFSFLADRSASSAHCCPPACSFPIRSPAGPCLPVLPSASSW